MFRIFDGMGKVFSFVTSDVHEKIGILQHHLASDVGAHYTTVERMIEYEVANGITTSGISRGQPSGSRTLLRLHRALKFLILLFSEIAKWPASSTEKFSALTWHAYDATLAQHHPWIVRGLVQCALYTSAPSRSSLFRRMDPAGSQEQINDQLNAAVLAMQPVYDCVQASYKNKDLLQLP